MKNENLKINGLLACAGKSGRMGKPKPLLVYKGLPFCILILVKMNLICEKIAIVLGFEAELIQSELKKYLTDIDKLKHELKEESLLSHIKEMENKVEFVINENFEEGMFSSLQCGIEKLIDSDWVLYHFTDQPTIPISFYFDFLKQLDENFDWIQPRYNLQNGHPIFINHNLFQEIIFSSRHNDLRKLSSKSSIEKKYWDCTYPQVLEDIDTPKDFYSI